MGQHTEIQWCYHTFNHVRGCQRVSEGCRFCYAEAGSKRNPTVLGVWGAESAGGKRTVAAESYWRQPIKWDRDARAAGERRRVFCASLADVFEEWAGRLHDVQGRELWVSRDAYGTWDADDGATGFAYDHRPLTLDEVRARVLKTIHLTPGLDWLLLTKRPENVMPILERMRSLDAKRFDVRDGLELAGQWALGCTMPNLWIGATVENRKQGVPRIEILRSIPAKVRFLSAEPLLEDIGEVDLTGIHLVIIGGESDQGGNKARPFDLQWARNLIKRCRKYGSAVFVKQWGSRPYDSAGADHLPDVDRPLSYEEATSPAGLDALAEVMEAMTIRLRDHHGGDWDEWTDEALKVREMPAAAQEARC